MHVKSIFAALVIVAAPVYAQAQKPTRADAQKVFEIISSDKGKLQIFCDIEKLGDQMLEEANENKDFKKIEELNLKAEELGRKLPEYGVLMNGIQNVDPDSEDGRQISSTLEALDDLCD